MLLYERTNSSREISGFLSSLVLFANFLTTCTFFNDELERISLVLILWLKLTGEVEIGVRHSRQVV